MLSTPEGVTREEYVAALMSNKKTSVKLTAIDQTYGDNDDPIIFTAQDIEMIGGLQLTSFMNSDIDLTMGRAVMDELNVAIFRSEKTEALTWSGEFKLEMGVDVTQEVDGEDEPVTTTYYVTVGYYIGTTPERSVQDDVINFRLLDRMKKFDRPASDYLKTLTINQTANDYDSTATYALEDLCMHDGKLYECTTAISTPEDWNSAHWTEVTITIEELYHGLCTYCGVSYEAGDELEDILDREYTAIPFGDNGVKCRDVLAWIAEACCCYARVNAAGKVKMVWYTDHMDDYAVVRNNEFSINVMEIDFITDDTLKKTWADLEDFTWEELEDYFWGELEGAKRPFKIHALNVRQMVDDSGIMIPSSADRNIYMIVDNPFLKTANSTEEDTYLDPIYERLTGFGSYVPTSVECKGNWLVEPGDIITVEVGKNNMSKLPVFSRVLRWSGGCTDIYEATGNLEREIISPYNNMKMIEGGRMHVMRQSIDETYEKIQNELGDYSTRQQTAQAISMAVASKPDIIYSTTAPSTTGLATGTIWVNTSPYLQTQADDYDSTATYDEGDLCKHDGSVYEANTDISTAEAWNSSHWDLYESPVPKNEWKKWNGSSWDEIGDNTNYEKQSGIDIESDGVRIYGNNYLKIESGGSLDVKSTNFEISSADKKMVCGNNTFDNNGFTYESNGKKIFIGQASSIDNSWMGGVVGDIDTVNSRGVTQLFASPFDNGSIAALTVECIKEYESLFQQYYYNSYVYVKNTGSNKRCILGNSLYPFEAGHIRNIYGTKYSSYVSGTEYKGIHNEIRLCMEDDPQNNYPYSILSIYSTTYDRSKIAISPFYNPNPQSGVSGNTADLVIEGKLRLGSFTYSNVLHDFNCRYAYVETEYYTNPPTARSSRDVKHDIQPMLPVGEKIDKLEPVTFVYDDDPDEKTRSGLIYEDTIEVLPEICTGDEENKGISYVELIPMLLKEVQDLRKRVKELEERLGE